MGIGVVLIFYSIAFSITAILSAIALGVISFLLTRHVWPRSKHVVIASALFPFLCVGYAGGWFVTYWVINDQLFHRDPGLGDGWYTPLPNGYSLSMIDTTDQGSIYIGSQQSNMGLVVDGVRQLQVSNSLIFGARDTGYFGRIGQDSNVVDAYFELNTANKTHTEFKSLEELRQRATSEGVALNLREFDSVFSDYRYTWFDDFALAALLLIPISGFLALARWVLKVRKSSHQLPEVSGN